MAVEWIENDMVVVFGMEDTTRQSIDQFVKDVKETRDAWDKMKPFLAIYNMSHGNILLTPYVRKKITTLADTAPPELYGAYSVVVANTIIGKLISVMLNYFLARQPNFEGRAFLDYENAVRWINEQSLASTK